MRFPIDVSNLSFIAGSDPAGVMDMEGRQRSDKTTGELLWGMDVVALGGEDGAEVWNVRIAGEPKGISTGQPVKVEGLTAMTWEIDGRHGISFRARRLEAADCAPTASTNCRPRGSARRRRRSCTPGLPTPPAMRADVAAPATTRPGHDRTRRRGP